jgi:hypothetical protein
MYRVGNLSIEASTLIFDPYKLTATGFPGKYCYVRGYADYGQEDFQDNESGDETRNQLA